jgi:hypothetical protein
VGIGLQRMTEHLGIAAVVLGSRHREAIAKAVELLGIDGMNRKALIDQHLDHRPVRRLDRHRYFLRLTPAHRDQPCA